MRLPVTFGYALRDRTGGVRQREDGARARRARADIHDPKLQKETVGGLLISGDLFKDDGRRDWNV